MLGLVSSPTRRAFLRLMGAVSAFVLLVRCKTTGAESLVKADGPEAQAKFLAASGALTGFQGLDNTLGPQFLADLRLAHGDGPVDQLLAKWGEIAGGGGNVESLIQAQIMGDATLAPVAGAAIMLWYGGVFAKTEVLQPVAVKAYQKALVWKGFGGGKPMGIPAEDAGSWGEVPGDA